MVGNWEAPSLPSPEHSFTVLSEALFKMSSTNIHLNVSPVACGRLCSLLLIQTEKKREWYHMRYLLLPKSAHSLDCSCLVYFQCIHYIFPSMHRLELTPICNVTIGSDLVLIYIYLISQFTYGTILCEALKMPLQLATFPCLNPFDLSISTKTQQRKTWVVLEGELL